MITLNISFNCIPSSQRAFERKGAVGLYRSMQWPVSVTSSCCWAGFRCRDADVGDSFSVLVQGLSACEGGLRASVCKNGLPCLMPSLLLLKLPDFIPTVWLGGHSFCPGK